MTTHTKGAKAGLKDGFEQQMKNQNLEILKFFSVSHEALMLEFDKEPIQGNDNNTISAYYLPGIISFSRYSNIWKSS